MNTEMMNQFEGLDNMANGIVLSEQDLLSIDGGSWLVAAGILGGAYVIYQFGEAAGRTIYYIKHP